MTPCRGNASADISVILLLLRQFARIHRCRMAHGHCQTQSTQVNKLCLGRQVCPFLLQAAAFEARPRRIIPSALASSGVAQGVYVYDRQGDRGLLRLAPASTTIIQCGVCPRLLVTSLSLSILVRKGSLTQLFALSPVCPSGPRGVMSFDQDGDTSVAVTCSPGFPHL